MQILEILAINRDKVAINGDKQVKPMVSPFVAKYRLLRVPGSNFCQRAFNGSIKRLVGTRHGAVVFYQVVSNCRVSVSAAEFGYACGPERIYCRYEIFTLSEGR